MSGGLLLLLIGNTKFVKINDYNSMYKCYNFKYNIITIFILYYIHGLGRNLC